MIFILNGPPHCGKDTIAARLVDQIGAISTMFKFDLYAALAERYGVSLARVTSICTNRDTKEYPTMMFHGKTPREALIHISEDILKPLHGKDYFGQCAKKRLQRILPDPFVDNKLIVFSDGGFEAEIAPLSELDDVVIVRLYGRGTFENDSRDYVTNDDFTYVDILLQENKPQLAVDELILYYEENKHD